MTIAEIEAHAGCASALDAAAIDAGDNAMCTESCSPDNIFLAAGHTGPIGIQS